MAGQDVSSDRLWFWFAVSSTVFVGILAISPVKDYLREYRTYQERYRGLLLETAGSAAEVRKARSVDIAIRQIWIPAFEDRVDRCVTCHLGVENPRMAEAPQPFRSHPATPHAPEYFQRFGCVACHRGQGRATSLAEAHGDTPDWESPLLPREFTEASCGRCHPGDAVPEASLLSEGRALVRRAGCFACHKVNGIDDWSSDAPDLNGLSLKTSPEWLRAWLRAPRDLQPNTLMPDFGLSEPEIEALVAFLWAQPPSPSQTLGPADEAALPGDPGRGRTLFGESRCVSCHTIEGRGNGSAPDVAAVGSKVGRRWLMAYLRDPHAFQPRTPMPRYNFSRQDLLDLSSYIVSELTDPQVPAPGALFRPPQKAVEEGGRLYRKYGCAGCHRIAGSDLPAEAGPELTGIGDKPAALLDFGARADLPRTLPAWLAAKVANPRSFGEGLKMPRFGFTDDQVRAVVTALLSLGARPVPQAYRVQEPRPRYEPPGRFGALVERYRCLACHQIEGVGGDISRAPLTVEGSRVRREWLVRYMLLPGTIRPLLTDRMIPLRMPREEAVFFAEFMENVFVDNSVPGEIFPGGPSPREVERGRSLFFERYGCQACHMVGGRGGYYGPLLDGVGERLESGWVLWWLLGPQRWRADVRCPNYGLEEKDARDLAAYVVSIPAAVAAPDRGR